MGNPLSIEAAIDQIEAALFTLDELGCYDPRHISPIGRSRLKAILKRLRVGYIKHTPIEDMDPRVVALRRKKR